MRKLICILMAACLLAPALSAQAVKLDEVVVRLVKEGFANVRSAETEEFVAYSLECDSYKIPAEGIKRVRQIVEGNYSSDKPLKIVVTHMNIPQLTLDYEPSTGVWDVTRRLDEGWDAVRGQTKLNSSLGKVDINIYPQLSLKNLIINQVYQTLWNLNPALEVSLWPGMKFSYQVKLPIYNDGYGQLEDKVHPGMVTLSQRFRDPWGLNLQGKFTVGAFSSNRYGAALEMMYHFPNERFYLDTQLAMLGNAYFDSFIFKYDKDMYFRWNVAANYYWPMMRTQFILRAQKFLLGDVGVKYEMIRHFDRCSVGLYAEKGPVAQLNVGFRFQIALPPYRNARRGYVPRVSTSSNMGMTYVANNELYYYKEFRTEASDNIMSNNFFNPYYIENQIR